jgi:MOSC domain-containing protein YiiM
MKDLIMLETATDEELEKLALARGKAVRGVNLREIPIGSLIQIRTESGNIYILETTNNITPCAHIARISPNTHTRMKGYLGEQIIFPPIIYLDEPLSHDEFTTRRVVSIEKLSE